jgi:hypothetical protein
MQDFVLRQFRGLQMRSKHAVLLIRKRQQNYIRYCLSRRVGTRARKQRRWLDRPCQSFNDCVFFRQSAHVRFDATDRFGSSQETCSYRQNLTDVRRNMSVEGSEKSSLASSPSRTVRLPRHPNSYNRCPEKRRHPQRKLIAHFVARLFVLEPVTFDAQDAV